MRFVDPDRYAALKATGQLISPKGIALAIIRLLQRDDYRINEVVQLVQSDPAIAGRVLYFANAAIFGRSRPLVSLQGAIVALGTFRLRDLIIGLSVMNEHRQGRCPAFDYDGFWAHSLATAIACQQLAQFAQIASEEIFTIGLLARVGELALASIYPEEYSQLLLALRGAHTDLAQSERQHFAMDHRELGASILREWGLPDVLIEAAFHHRDPEAAGFADGSRVQTLTQCLAFASTLARMCMADEEGRWSLLPALLARGARLGVDRESLDKLVDEVVKRWREWGKTLHLRTRDLPPFADIVAASPPMRRMGGNGGSDGNGKHANAGGLLVQLIGVATDEGAALAAQIEALGHRPRLLEATPAACAQALRRPGQMIIIEASIPGLDLADFCRRLRLSATGKDNYTLLLAAPEFETQAQQAVDAGADDVLYKPVNAQTLRVHLKAAARLLQLKDEIQRERTGVLRSTDEFALAQKRLLQDALTDPLTQLANRRNGLDFLSSEAIFARASGAPLALLMLDIDHFKRINDRYGHAAGDAILRQLADVLRRVSRSGDLIFRYGGEEFAAVLTDADRKMAQAIGERIRAQVEANDFVWENEHIPLTLSVGAAVASSATTDSAELIKAADAAMYQAKAAGRNRVVVAA